MGSVFKAEDVQILQNRIDSLNPESQAQWGKMNVAQMLAHCNVSYEMAFEDKHPKAKGFKKMMLKWFVKPIVVGDKAYKRNSPTAPEFKMTDAKEFEKEKERLKNYLVKTNELGASWFDGKESNSFGNLSVTEWDKMFYKHLDHHLTQFGA